eukprot:scaffold86659_cov45-Phaeocystis_antarctica.AAC.2
MPLGSKPRAVCEQPTTRERQKPADKKCHSTARLQHKAATPSFTHSSTYDLRFERSHGHADVHQPLPRVLPGAEAASEGSAAGRDLPEERGPGEGDGQMW